MWNKVSNPSVASWNKVTNPIQSGTVTTINVGTPIGLLLALTYPVSSSVVSGGGWVKTTNPTVNNWNKVTNPS